MPHTRIDRSLERHLLAQAGLRVSLSRIKVLSALSQSIPLSTLELHQVLVGQGENISLLSVRQVVCRMKDAGLLLRDELGAYRLVEPPRLPAEAPAT